MRKPSNNEKIKDKPEVCRSNPTLNIRNQGTRILQDNGGGKPVIAKLRQRKTNKRNVEKLLLMKPEANTVPLRLSVLSSSLL